MGKKDKNKKTDKKMGETQTKQVKEATSMQTENKDDVKEVLQLFSKLEELVVDGDPRVREALNQKPGLQSLMRDDSSMFGLTPHMQAMQAQQGLLYKDGTNPSLLSFRNPAGAYHAGIQTSPRKFVGAMQTHPTMSKSPRRNIVVPPIMIPERSLVEDVYEDGHIAARIQRHPDGTLVSKTLDPQPIQNIPISSRNVPNTTDWAPQPSFPSTQAPIIVPQVYAPVTVAQPKPQLQAPPKFHAFNYDTDRGLNSVRIEMPTETQNATQPQRVPPQLGYNIQAHTADPIQVLPQPRPYAKDLAMEDLTSTHPDKQGGKPHSLNYRSAAYKSKGTESFSKVIGPEGGRITCFGCSMDVPKNALKHKALFRLSVLDASQLPHQMDRIYNYYTKEGGEILMAISPAVRIDPADLKLEKPVTIKLPTCIAVSGQKIERDEEGRITKRENTDIETGDIVVKQRNLQTNEIWKDYETEVFRSADSVTFKLDKFGDMCAFHSNNGETVVALNKRISIFLFKSMDTRKNQFISILACEDLPHVIQKAIEGMPHWLKYSDSCFNVIMPEGRNLSIYIEAKDRSLCYVDANKIEIPWENLWHPECIIRKHIRIILVKQEVPAEVQLILDEGQVQLSTMFMWQVKQHSIYLPDIMTSEEEPNANAGLGTAIQGEEYLRTVSWKPSTPAPKIITNKGILNYAAMGQ